MARCPPKYNPQSAQGSSERVGLQQMRKRFRISELEVSGPETTSNWAPKAPEQCAVRRSSWRF
eukprot:2373210-Alexandrium_andersonii.AAC.1